MFACIAMSSLLLGCSEYVDIIDWTYAPLETQWTNFPVCLSYIQEIKQYLAVVVPQCDKENAYRLQNEGLAESITKENRKIQLQITKGPFLRKPTVNSRTHQKLFKNFDDEHGTKNHDNILLNKQKRGLASLLSWRNFAEPRPRISVRSKSLPRQARRFIATMG